MTGDRDDQQRPVVLTLTYAQCQQATALVRVRVWDGHAGYRDLLAILDAALDGSES